MIRAKKGGRGVTGQFQPRTIGTRTTPNQKILRFFFTSFKNVRKLSLKGYVMEVLGEFKLIEVLIFLVRLKEHSSTGTRG